MVAIQDKKQTNKLILEWLKDISNKRICIICCWIYPPCYWGFVWNPCIFREQETVIDSKVHGANMGAIWGRQDPGGPHVGPKDFAIWDVTES